MKRVYDDMGEYLSALDSARERATTVYAALKAAGKIKDHRVIAYRCATNRRCLLLDVLQIPGQVIVHSPAYRLSPSHNAADSSESGRATNTRDGNRRWNDHTYPAESAMNFVLNCDHVASVVLDKTDLQADVEAGHAAILVNPDGTRYPVR